ncbi:hypothetical protein O181_089510 [Austropuccinia psidii MF-1]|uniref:Uncharacterized protein n=1 Tax=Austropuccinia psidii MF-1 TaxID=1389203 RepID=A0A9Q3ITE5_9BASI|nr:hypothetical protein [Austropuccinia psidii MF-1]
MSKTSFKGLGEDDEEEDSEYNEAFPDPMGDSEGTGEPTLDKYNKPFSHQSNPFLLAIMQQMTQIMANI